MPRNASEQKAEVAYRAVLAHSQYANVSTSADTETQIAEMVKGLKVLSRQYGTTLQVILDQVTREND